MQVLTFTHLIHEPPHNMAEEYFHINKKTKMDFDEDEHTDDSDNDTDCLVSDSDRDSDTIEEDKIILVIFLYISLLFIISYLLNDIYYLYFRKIELSIIIFAGQLQI